MQWNVQYLDVATVIGIIDNGFSLLDIFRLPYKLRYAHGPPYLCPLNQRICMRKPTQYRSAFSISSSDEIVKRSMITYMSRSDISMVGQFDLLILLYRSLFFSSQAQLELLIVQSENLYSALHATYPGVLSGAYFRVQLITICAVVKSKCAV